MYNQSKLKRWRTFCIMD